ncbi:hypothetical protein KP79_PYT12981 [Mizuhopecten yessoensis]|uniref:Uncharacterized protein n=1 Tax=Mizuhopecten yessoensis TaxID=6573 RepID=A0A210QR27_MIZYE|nr:hypothetical protein KP79_PYT12981 [Mizuhopecten yessoensis]
MDDNSLMEYLPHEGDRIALKGFCKTSSDTKGNTSSDRKSALFASLRKKLKMKEAGKTCTPDENPRKKSHLSGNKNAKKSTRKIELGWLHYDITSQMFKQVRKRNGGGTRKLDVDKESDKGDLEEKAKALFFPHGMSKIGAIEDYTTEVRDFSEDLITSMETVGEMYQRTGMNVLRFFLATTLKSSSKSFGGNFAVGTSSTASNTATAVAQASHLNISFSSCSASSSDSLPSLNNSIHTETKYNTSLSTETSKALSTSTPQSVLNPLPTFSGMDSMIMPTSMTDTDHTADTLNWEARADT